MNASCRKKNTWMKQGKGTPLPAAGHSLYRATGCGATLLGYLQRAAAYSQIYSN